MKASYNVKYNFTKTEEKVFLPELRCLRGHIQEPTEFCNPASFSYTDTQITPSSTKVSLDSTSINRLLNKLLPSNQGVLHSYSQGMAHMQSPRHVWRRNTQRKRLIDAMRQPLLERLQTAKTQTEFIKGYRAEKSKRLACFTLC